MSHDPLDGTPTEAANHAHLEALTRCLLRELTPTCQDPTTSIPRPGPERRLDLDLAGHRLRADFRRWSPTGHHRFGPFRLTRADGTLITDSPDAALVAGLAATTAGGSPEEITELIARTADSTRNVRGFIAARRDERATPSGVDGFLDAEQALLLGHLTHPTPKSREGLSPGELRAFSPETRGRFQAHWFAADPSIARWGATLSDTTVPRLMAQAAGVEPDERVLIPAHPWQAGELVHRPVVHRLLEAGSLRALGPLGAPWWPTSSLRTVYRPDFPIMMKLSLGLALTNSRRELTAEFLRRGPEVHLLLTSGYAETTFAAHPGFSIVRDPAWLALAPGGDGEPTGLEVALREVPADLNELRCLAGLLAPRPGIGPNALVELCRASGLGGARWVADYVDQVLVPMLHLYASTGIGLEAHQQNTLIRLRDGRIKGAAFRDNEGYYLAASHLPGVLSTTGADGSDLAVAEDTVVDERLSYYLLRNQAFGVVAALAEDTDERELLAVLADRLRCALPALAAAGPDGDRLARRWLSAPTLPCKANLLTRLRGIDEMRAPLSAQSVYLDVPNPLESW